MKVYRFVKWTNLDRNGNFNELMNLNKLGLISPSYSYLCNECQIYNDGANTFEDENEMHKFFFGSIVDAIWLSAKEKIGNNLVIELDIPEELLKRNIGIGYYGSMQVEYAIPYKDLFLATAKTYHDYLKRALDYYNDNLYVDYLSEQDGYQDIEALLPLVPYQGIYMQDRLSIYPLFCYEPKVISVIKIDESKQKEYQRVTEELKVLREKRYNFENKVIEITGASNQLMYYNINYSKERLFDFSYPIIEEENKELSRILMK